MRRRPSSIGSRVGSVLFAAVVIALACGHRTGEEVAAVPPPAPDLLAVSANASDEADDETGAPSVSADAIVQRIVEIGYADSHVHDHLRHLTQKIGPRLTGSHNLMDAEVWCRDQFASWGLHASLERWGDFPVGFDRGPWSGRVVAPVEQRLEFTTPAWTPGALGPVRGPVVLAPMTVAEAKRNLGKFAGAWVLQPPRRKDKRKPKVKERIEVLLRDAKFAGYISSARSDKGLVHTSGRYRVSWDALPTDVQIRLRADQYQDLRTRAEKGEKVEVEFSIDNRFFRGPVPQHNVIADLRGSEKPDEYVIVGGHLDSWDGATGANDNGTGVSTTLEAARLLVAAGARPKRTIRFMLWSGEEQGLLGSEGYVEKHRELMPSISAVLVHDGGTNYLSGLGVTPEMYGDITAATDVLTRLDLDMPFEVRLADSLRPGGSDHSPFIRAGAPGFFWDQDGKADYKRVHHTQHDNIRESREDYQQHSALVVALTAYNLANLDGLLDRTNSAPIARRRLGVDFDGLKVAKVTKGGKAASAGWKPGDTVVEVEGTKVERMWDIVRAIQKGGPKKTVVVERKGKRIETVLDYSGDPAEQERAQRREARRAAGLPLPGEEASGASASKRARP